MPPHKCSFIVISSAVLHNMVINAGITLDEEAEEDEDNHGQACEETRWGRCQDT